MKLIYKQIYKSLLSAKANVIILFILSLLSSFMYFFVQVLIDGNRSLLNNKIAQKISLTTMEKELLVSLHSNQILALSFLIILSLIAGFIYFMFYKKYASSHQREIGCYLTLGYSSKKIAGILFLITLIFNCISFFAGLCLGWLASDIMLNLYKDTYSLDYLKKGIELKNYMLGFCISVVFPALFVIPIIGKSDKLDIIRLLNEEGSSSQTSTGNLIRYIPSMLGFSMRMALKKPFQILMSFFAVGLFTLLFIMSISLNLSSQYLYKTQTYGRNYQYNIQYDTYKKIPVTEAKKSYYIAIPTVLKRKEKTVNSTIMGIENAGSLFSLVNSQGKSLMNIPLNEVVISQAISELYGIQKNETISIILSNSTIVLHVFDIAENAENFTLYVSKGNLEEILDLHQESYNGLFTNDLSGLSGKEIFHIQNISERNAELKENTVSNRMSAVICQVLGCVIGCLLIYLTLLLKFQEDTKNIFILGMLGYSSKQINKMIIGIYQPVLNLAFLLLLMPSIEICKIIHRSLSLATADYIPFQTNISVIIIIWSLLNGIYLLIRYIFNLKIWHVQNSGETAKYLM